MKSFLPRLLGGLMCFGLALGVAQASTTDWTAQLTITAPGAAPQSLVIGTSANGKDGYYGGEDIGAPPAPPLGGSPTATIAVRHTVLDGFPSLINFYVKDIRAPIHGGQSKTWSPIFASTTIDGTQGNTIRISWVLNGVPPNIQLKFGDGVIPPIDMSQASMYTYTQTDISATLTKQFQVVATNTSPAVGLVGAIAQQNLTSNGLTFVFTTDRPANAQVVATPVGGGAPITATLTDFTTQHTVNLIGLAPNAAYSVVITAAASDPSIDALVPPAIPIQTPPQAIQISGLTATPTATDATITWTTDLASDSKLEYGPTASYGQTASDPSVVQAHSLKATGLTPSTLYHYHVISTIPGKGQAISGDQTFTTLSPAIQITQTPTISNLTASSVTITWTTDLASDSTVKYGLTTNYDQTSLVTTPTTQHVITLKNLKPNSTYHFSVSSSAAGHPTTSSTDATFQTPTGMIQFISGPAVISRTGSSATLVWGTNVPTDTVVHFGVGVDLSQSVTGPNNVSNHVVTLTGLQPKTAYSFQVVSNATGYSTLTSPALSFTTLTAGENFAFVDTYNVLDSANDSTGQIKDQTSALFGATTGGERGIAYDAQRGIVYIARGTMTTEDGRATGQFGVAAIKLAPPNKSNNPNVPDATSNYVDTGLIVAPTDVSGKPGLGFVQSLAYDPASDTLYVFSGSPGGGPSKTPRVYSAPGGTLGGAPNGGDTSRPNPALSTLFDVSEPTDSQGSLLGGNNRGIAARTSGGVTTVYMAMAQHADVWANDGGSWHRAWTSDLFPADASADTSLRLSDTAVRSVTVDDAGNSYWPVSAATTAPRIWVFPPSASGTGVGFNDSSFGGTHATGIARPLIIGNDGTLIPPANFTFPVDAKFLKDGASQTLFVSSLGSDQRTPSIARILLTSDPSAAGAQINARVVDAFGPGATGAIQDKVLQSLTVKGTAGQTQPSAPPAAANLLYMAVSPLENTLYLNAFVTNDQAGQTIPTSGVVKVAYGGLIPRPFITSRPQVTSTGSSVTVTWSTDVATTDNRVEYGPDSHYGQVAVEPPVDGGSQNHSVTIAGLTPGAVYHFHVVSGGANLQTATTPDDTFTVGSSRLAPGDLNGDGVVDVKDATISLEIAVKLIQPSAAQVVAGDVNHDGVLNIQDTTLILRAAVHLIKLP